MAAVAIADNGAHYTFSGTLLGEGTHSKVVLATDCKGNKVAVKVFNNSALSERARKLVDQEIQVLKRLGNHPNIIKLINSIDQENVSYMVQEYIEGGDLFEYVIKHPEEMTERRVKRIFSQMVRGVHYLHQKGIVHHDLKLENVGLKGNDTVALMDFGLCSEFTHDQPLSRFCGTLSYSSPELLLGKPYPPTPVDVWSLGVSLFVMLVKRFPFNSENPKLLYKQATCRDYIQSLIHSCDMSDDARDLLMKIFVANPCKRISVPDILRHRFMKGVDGLPESNSKESLNSYL